MAGWILSSMIINTVEERCVFCKAASPNNLGNAKAIPQGEMSHDSAFWNSYLETKTELRIYPRQSGGPMSSSLSFLMLFSLKVIDPGFIGWRPHTICLARADI